MEWHSNQATPARAKKGFCVNVCDRRHKYSGDDEIRNKEPKH